MSEFNWNWQNTPLDLRMQDARSRAAAEAMQGYVPNEANPLAGLEQISSPAAIAASNMEGYRPAMVGYSLPNSPATVQAPSLGGEGGNMRSPFNGVLGTGSAYTEREALMSEYRANEEKIKLLEAKVKTIADAWEKGKAGRERAALDEMDRELAMSRAKYGDFSGAYGHLNRIDSRALAAMSKEDSAETRKEKLNKIVGELEAAYIMRNSGDATTQADWNNKIRRLLVEYKDLAGKDYVYDGSSPDTTNYGEGAKVKDIMAYDSKVSNLKTLRTDGRITDAQFNELWSDLERLPNGPEKDKRREELFELGKNSVEKAAKKSADYTAKVNKAVNEFIKGEKKFSTEDKKALKKEGGSATVTRNGVEMTVKYTGLRDGKKSYEVYVNGKRKGYYQE